MSRLIERCILIMHFEEYIFIQSIFKTTYMLMTILKIKLKFYVVRNIKGIPVPRLFLCLTSIGGISTLYVNTAFEIIK